MNCKGVQSRLSAYIDRELSGSEMLQLRAHLSECDECAREETELRRLKSLLAAGATSEPDPGFEDRLLQHVFSGRTAEQRVVHRSFAHFRVVTAATAAALLAFAAMSLLGEADRQPTADAKQELRLATDQAYFSGTDPLLGGSVVPIGYAER